MALENIDYSKKSTSQQTNGIYERFYPTMTGKCRLVQLSGDDTFKNDYFSAILL
jgi:hypothetical protein